MKNIEEGYQCSFHGFKEKLNRKSNAAIRCISRIFADHFRVSSRYSTFKIPLKYQPKKDMPQVQSLFQDQYNRIMRKHGFDYEGDAQAGVLTCAIMTAYHCIANKDLEPKLAAEIVSYGFFVGGIIVPVPLI